ncbi:O-fucosyltransferase family protein [Sphingomonas aestuarii]
MNRSRVYAMPVLGRYGLTHGLLAWARCRVWCEQNGAAMIAPFWLKLRVGPYLRRERDKRNYFMLFNGGGAISGIGRLLTLGRARRIEVGTEWPANPSEEGGSPVLMRFHNAMKDNEKKSFSQILGHGAFLRREVLAMTRQRYHPSVPNDPFVAIHVRMGDFTPISSQGEVGAEATNTRLPIDWYGDRLDALRRSLGHEIQAIVFSDGSDEDLEPLLRRSGVNRAAKQQSITDLLTIGHGVALIASGSGFSLWGAFLGSVPRISYPGQSIVPIDKDETRDIELSFGENIPQTFAKHVQLRMADK